MYSPGEFFSHGRCSSRDLEKKTEDAQSTARGETYAKIAFGSISSLVIDFESISTIKGGLFNKLDRFFMVIA
jgi:hypothetical protein